MDRKVKTIGEAINEVFNAYFFSDKPANEKKTDRKQSEKPPITKA